METSNRAATKDSTTKVETIAANIKINTIPNKAVVISIIIKIDSQWEVATTTIREAALVDLTNTTLWPLITIKTLHKEVETLVVTVVETKETITKDALVDSNNRTKASSSIKEWATTKACKVEASISNILPITTSTRVECSPETLIKGSNNKITKIPLLNPTWVVEETKGTIVAVAT